MAEHRPVLSALYVRTETSKAPAPIDMIETVLYGKDVRPKGVPAFSFTSKGVEHRVALSAVPDKIRFRAVTKIATRNVPFKLDVPLNRRSVKDLLAQD